MKERNKEKQKKNQLKIQFLIQLNKISSSCQIQQNCKQKNLIYLLFP